MNKLVYDVTNKEIIQQGFDNLKTKKTESIFAQGNGYLGIRAVDEERNFFNKEDFFVNGMFNIGDFNEVSELANLADLLQTSIFLDGKLFQVEARDKYQKSINLNNGLLTRIIQFKRNKKFFKITFQRIIDQTNKHFYAQKIDIEQLNGSATEVIVQPLINGQTTNHGVQHFKEGFKKLINKTTIQYEEETSQSQRWAIHTMNIKFYDGRQILESGSDNYVIKMARRQIGFNIKSTINPQKKVTIEKNMSIYTSVDKGLPTKEILLKKAAESVKWLEKQKFSDFLKQAKLQWKKIYQQFDLKIEGRSKAAQYDQLAFQFSIFHMNSFVPQDNPYSSIGAKGMTGEGYQGHCYWDTEFFIVPNYIFTKPQIARNLLEYRYKGIVGARNKAQEQKMQGAQYPWEMAWPTDGEVTPYWGQPDIVTGKQVPIASRESEIHVPGDIAYAIDQYFQATNDQQFMEQMGYEMIIDTAIFWTSRVEPKGEQYQITNVMGPNEYKGNIDNNNFTNLIAKRNLELALKYINLLKQTSKGQEILALVNAKIPYKYSVSKMQHIIDKLIQQLPNKNLIIAENDQFLQLPKMDITPFKFLGDAGKKLFNTTAGIKRLSAQLVKQADVVLSMFIFGELFSKEICKANFNYYEPLTTHDSSLSATTYAIKAIDLRKMSQAYQLFKYAINIDMGPNFDSSDAGIHAGSLAAVWQTIVYGYGGMRFLDGKMHFNPILPRQWEKLTYSINYQSCKILVNVFRNHFTLKVSVGESVNVYVANQLVELSKRSQKFLVQHD